MRHENIIEFISENPDAFKEALNEWVGELRTAFIMACYGDNHMWNNRAITLIADYIEEKMFDGDNYEKEELERFNKQESKK